MHETPYVALPLEEPLSLPTLARACCVDSATIEAWVAEGLLEADGNGPPWQFDASEFARALQIARLQRELALDSAGAAICVELLTEIERLRARIRVLEWQWPT